MAYTTKKPTGLSIKRNGNNLTVTWKIGDKNYGQGQTFQYRVAGGKWTSVSIGNAAVKKTVSVPVANYCPNTTKTLGKMFFRIRGRRSNFTSNSETIKPRVSDWATKDFDILYPNVPTISCALDSSYNNISTFSWATTVATDSTKWFSVVQCQTRLERNSNVTDGSQLSAGGWSAYSATSASGSATITEDSSVVNAGTSYTRWFRIRARGLQGSTAWRYARHVYAIPYQVKSTTASVKTTDAGGYMCTVHWSTPRDAAHPVDSINVQYAFAVPDAGLTCPDTASWQDAETLAYKDGSDASAFSIDSIVGVNQCLFVRVNTIHDRNTTYGSAVCAAIGTLTAPSSLTVSIDSTTHQATVAATNGSTVSDSFLVVKYMTDSNPNGFDIGIIPSGSSSVTVQCPAFTSTTTIKFGAYACVGSYRATTRADGVTSYAVTVRAKSSLVTYGGTVPAAPTSVVLSKTDTAGTIRVAWNWSWSTATFAELSWADHEDAWESTEEPDTYIVNSTHASAWNISGLDTGVTWYVRVRLGTGTDTITYGAYSDTVSIDLSSAPTIPVLALSNSVITEDGVVTAAWSFVSSDGTAQAFAEVAEVASGTYTILATTQTAQNVTISAKDVGWSTGETHDIVVRVTSASGKQSDGWSDPVSVTVAEPLTTVIASTSLIEQTFTDDSDTRTVLTLTEMPFTATITGAGAGGTTRLIIERREDYHVSRPDETEFNGYEGETVLIYSQLGEGAITISNADLIGKLDDGASYRLIATVQDGLGQSDDETINFEVKWSHQAIAPTATVDIDDDNLIAVIVPIAPSGAAASDTADIYRLSADRPELIYPDAVFGTSYVDPYPAIGDYGGYRVVTKTANGDYITDDNELAWADYDGGLDTDDNIIDFGTGRVLLPYNVNLSNAWAKDFVETKYLGGSIQGDWNPAVSRTGTFSTVVVVDDELTIEAMRRLATYPGICHVRTKDGSSYAADVQVSETYAQEEAHMLSSFALTITRVDSETYDGMTLADWTAAGGDYG